MIEDENRLGIVILARPYHNDKGLNHSIPEEFQKIGYPIFTLDSLPINEDKLNHLFKEDLDSKLISSPMEIKDVWKNSFSENTNKKIWAAKFVARHPNLVAVELSNFKCGHDAPIYSVIRKIVENSGTPFFSFRDIDENKPTGSIKIRIETIDYFLKKFQAYRKDYADKILSVEAELKIFEKQIREKFERDNFEFHSNIKI
jgi:predicted nucleotide-binding protein (sugar kinase/HSP70/actin superfamily)